MNTATEGGCGGRQSLGVFIVAGNRLLREALSRVLTKRPDIRVLNAAPFSSETLQEIVVSRAEVLLLDSVSSVVSDLSFVREVLRAVEGLKVILIGMEEDEDTFLKAVRAGAVGYVLKDASAMDVVAAVRAVAQEQAACPPRLCRALFKYVANQCPTVPNVRVKVQLGLTSRQQQLVPLIAQGLTNKEIASHLNLSEQTVKNHIHRMMQRVGVDDRLAVVEMVRDQGVLM